MNIIEIIVGTKPLKESLNPKLEMRQAVLEHYEKLGASLNLGVYKEFPLLFRGVPIGFSPVVWLGDGGMPEAAFECELLGTQYIAPALWRLAELAPKNAVLVHSAKAQDSMKLDELREFIETSKLLRHARSRFILIDIDTSAFTVCEKKEAPKEVIDRRRKVISGRKGEHKQQD